MSDDRLASYPVRESFSRQQVHERTGIADDILAFWIKQNLLVALPAAPRAHRRFSYEQLHIAAVLNAMRSLGANVGVLRKFSAMLQEGFTLWRSSGFDPSALISAASLCERLDNFARGYPVAMRPPAEEFRCIGYADNVEQVIQSWLWEYMGDNAGAELAAFAQTLTILQARSIRWALNLTDPSILALSDTGGSSAWVAWIDDTGNPRIAEGNENVLHGDNGPLAAFYIPISRLITRLWPERLEAACQRYKIQRHNEILNSLIKLEADDPSQASAYRKRMSISDDWADHYGIIDQEEGDDMTG